MHPVGNKNTLSGDESITNADATYMPSGPSHTGTGTAVTLHCSRSHRRPETEAGPPFPGSCWAHHCRYGTDRPTPHTHTNTQPHTHALAKQIIEWTKCLGAQQCPLDQRLAPVETTFAATSTHAPPPQIGARRVAIEVRSVGAINPGPQSPAEVGGVAVVRPRRAQRDVQARPETGDEGVQAGISFPDLSRRQQVRARSRGPATRHAFTATWQGK